jgi:hypothetical protein
MAYPKIRFGADKRSAKPVAGTSNDRRSGIAKAINDGNHKCKNGLPIVATEGQQKGITLVTCSCGISIEFAPTRGAPGYHDALGEHADAHEENSLEY